MAAWDHTGTEEEPSGLWSSLGTADFRHFIVQGMIPEILEFQGYLILQFNAEPGLEKSTSIFPLLYLDTPWTPFLPRGKFLS